ncbi:hypothetical protein WAH70_11795, partial [Acinetobacter baumannii]
LSIGSHDKPLNGKRIKRAILTFFTLRRTANHHISYFFHIRIILIVRIIDIKYYLFIFINTLKVTLELLHIDKFITFYATS